MMARQTERGFTLAETMVALFILALVSAAGSALLIGATGSSKQMREAENEARQLDIAMAFVRNDIAEMSRRAVWPLEGNRRAGNLFGETPRGPAPFLEFVRSGWINPVELEPRSDLQLVRYRLEEGDLIREAVTRPDASPGTPIAERVLLRGVRRIDMSFFREGERSEVWIGDAGQSFDVLPDLVDFDIQFETGGRLKITALTGGRP